MGVLNMIRETLRASTQSTNRGEGDERVTGSYWCEDCTERISAAESGTEPPLCPSCGDEMTLDRSPGTTGCAC